MQHKEKNQFKPFASHSTKCFAIFALIKCKFSSTYWKLGAVWRIFCWKWIY